MAGKLLERVRAVVSEAGPGVTLEDVRQRLGPEGMTCSSGTFHTARRQVFGPTRGVGVNGTVGNAPYSPDFPATFVSFAVAVERVGGIEAARRVLDEIERLWSILGGKHESS